jgi:hypothetical protein
MRLADDPCDTGHVLQSVRTLRQQRTLIW